MKLNRKKTYASCGYLFICSLIVFLLFGQAYINPKVQVNADKQEGTENLSSSPGGTVKNLSYGLVEASSKHAPNVAYNHPIDGSIQHIFNNGSGTTTRSFTTSLESYNETETLKYPLVLESSTPGGADGKEVTLRYLSKDDSVVTETYMELSPNETRSAIKHEFFVKNITDKIQKIYPVKQVDTKLGVNDKVPIYSRGPGKGLYINSSDYRLDYIMDVPNGPLLYDGKKYSTQIPAVFGEYTNQNNLSNTKDKDFVVLEEIDSGIFMSWGEVELAPGEIFQARYDIGISNLKLEKEAVNKNGTTKNRVGDEIEYTVTGHAPENFNNVELIDKLPKELEKPTEIKLKDDSGILTNLEVENVYDANTHSINLNIGELPANKSVSLIYSVKIKPTGSGKSIVNTATITGDLGGVLSEETVDNRLTVTELINGRATAHYQDETGDEIPGFPPIEKTGNELESFTFDQIEIDNYEFVKREGPLTGFFTKEPIETKFIYKEKKLDLIQSAYHLDGTDANQVTLGDTVKYKVDLATSFEAEMPEVFFKKLTLTEIVDSHLEIPTELTLNTSNGDSVGSVTYDEESHTITATISEEDSLPRFEKIQLNYQAKVKIDTPLGTVIRGKASAEGCYSNGSLVNHQESNEVNSTVTKGILLFESAPKVLSFGDNLKISSKRERYPIKLKDDKLSVKDLRGLGQKWTMTARMIQLLTNRNGQILSEAMYYKYNGNEQVMGLEDSVLIQKETTTTTSSVVISNTWATEESHPFVEVLPGQAKLGMYQGKIQWNLQDTP